MKRLLSLILLLCGLSFALAALPVYGQGKSKINRQPLKDFTDFLKEKVAKKEIDLTKPFSVEFEGTLSKDGKLDATKGKFFRVKGEENVKMNEVAQKGLAALSDSGCLVYLVELGAEKFNLNVVQDENTFSSVIKSEARTETDAKNIASALNMIISFGKAQAASEDEKLFLSSTEIAFRGKEFTIKTMLPKAAAQELIKRKLQETNRTDTISNSK